VPLKAGDVVRIPVAFKQGEPKFLVILSVDTHAHCVVINSSTHPLFSGVLRRPSIVEITVNEHPFMHHDCEVDCNEVLKLPLANVESEINSNASCYKGEITDACRGLIANAINISPFLAPSEKEIYIASLNSGSDE